MKNILIVIGSPKVRSFNKQFSYYAEKLLEKKVNVDFLDINHLPLLTPEKEISQDVLDMYNRVEESDGLWIFASEYNLSYTPSLKNFLDYLSLPIGENFEDGTHASYKKVCLTSVAGSSGGRFVLTKLVELTQFIGMNLMRDPMVGVTLEKEDFKKDVPTFKKHDIDALKKQAEAFLKFIEE